MTNQRRNFLKRTVLLTGSALAIKSPAIFGQTLSESLVPEQSAKNAQVIDSNKIDMKLPKIAEKGAAIPITVTSSLENIQSIAILIEKNIKQNLNLLGKNSENLVLLAILLQI